MFGFLRKKNNQENLTNPAVTSSSQFPTDQNDQVNKSIAKIKPDEERSVVDDLEELMKYRPASDPLERLKNLVRKNVFHFRSFELMSSYHMGLGAFWIGLLYRGRSSVMPAVERWKRQHNHSLFVNKNEYQRRLSGFILVSAIKEGGMVGFKYGVFVFSLSFLAQAIAAYRDELKLSDIVISGAISGGLSRFYYGITPTVIGSFTGTILGINNRELAEIQKIADETDVWMFTAKRMYKEQQKIEDAKREEYLKSKVS